MADRKGSRPVIIGDGWTPSKFGHQSTVQGGYVPTTSQVAAPLTPPTGGSAVKPAKP